MTKKCCKCPKTRKSRKPRKPRKSRKNLGAGPPDYFKDHSPRDQLERVLDLVKASNLKEIVTDAKTGYPVKFNTNLWSKLTYYNAYSVTGEYGTHADDMKTIVFMLKHDVYEHKKSNKDKWKKSINNAIFKGNYLEKFQDKPYNGPVIKEDPRTRITLKELTIILLENRLKILDWFNAKSRTEMAEMPAEMAENVVQTPIPNEFNLNREPPNRWNASDDEVDEVDKVDKFDKVDE